MTTTDPDREVDVTVLVILTRQRVTTQIAIQTIQQTANIQTDRVRGHTQGRTQGQGHGPGGEKEA